MNSPGRAASVHARLLNRAHEKREDFNLILGRYALERLLYRLSVSDASSQFVLKGALLFDLWFDLPHRPTRDADFLGFGPPDAVALTQTLRTICSIEADDGMVFDSGTVNSIAIKEEASYGGLRCKLSGHLGNARCPVQLDIGYGDVVTPEPTLVQFPTLLDDVPAPCLRAYPRESMVAEKLEAIVTLGMTNSRMKDYFDLHALMQEGAMDPADLARAVAATFQRRGTRLPLSVPTGLTREFGMDPAKQTQWAGFLNRNRLASPPLQDVVARLADWLMRVTTQAAVLRDHGR